MNRGYTLVEVVVAMLLSAIMISAVFSVALTGRTQTSSRGDCQVAAAQAAQALLQRLKNYVADPSYATSGITGPGPGGGWTIQGDGASYALSVGNHTTTDQKIIPASLSGAPCNASISYTVFAGSPQQVNVTVSLPNWN